MKFPLPLRERARERGKDIFPPRMGRVRVG